MRHDTGAALISVLMVVVVFLLLGTALLQWTAVEAIQVQRQEKQLQAHYLARSGLEVALSYVFEQVAQGVTVKDLRLSKLDGSLEEAGSYNVAFTRDSEEGSVEIRATGYVTDPGRAEETIRCKVYLESLLGEADRAEKIDPAWASLHNSNSGNHLELKAAHADTPLVHTRPVLFEADNHITLHNNKNDPENDHNFRAPAMEFSSKKLHIKNGSKLHLYTDYVAFKTKIDLQANGAELVLNTYSDHGDGSYGVVYFSQTLPGVACAGYYRFENGTTWKKDGKLKLQTPGKLSRISGPELPTFFSSRIVYSSGN
jgi:hypothetical protein